MSTKLQLNLIQAERADRAILDALPEDSNLSRSTLKSWFKSGQIKLKNRVIAASMILRPGPVELELPSEFLEVSDLQAEQVQGVALVYQDDFLLVLSKPSGLPSVPLQRSKSPSALGHALSLDPTAQILHRLDTGTSGLLAFAKGEAQWTRLRAAWKAGKVKKHYRALCRPETPSTPKPLENQVIDRPLGHLAKTKKKMTALPTSSPIRGNPLPAITEILSLREIRPDYLDLEIEIKTGVMHQIRCHLRTIGWPIQGDKIYGGCPSARLWLHAWRLEIPSPLGPPVQIEAKLPENWPT